MLTDSQHTCVRVSDLLYLLYIYIYIYHMRHWHALSHLLHFVRHEGRLATIGTTRVTRSMARAAN